MNREIPPLAKRYDAIWIVGAILIVAGMAVTFYFADAEGASEILPTTVGSDTVNLKSD